MKGYIKSRSKGSYRITLDLPASNGKRRRETFTVRGTKKEAEAVMARRISEVETGATASSGQTTLGQFMDRWLEAKAGAEIAGATLQRYREITERHIKPTLGHLPARKLTPLHIEDALTTWRQTDRGGNRSGKLSTRTVHHIYSTLRTALYQAQRWNVVLRNPCANVERVPKGGTEVKAIDVRRAIQLRNSMKGDDLYLPALVTIMTGLRRGELLALTWDDVDLKEGTIRVRRSLEVVGANDLRFKSPKTPKSRRTAVLTRQALEALRTHRAAQLRHKMRHRDLYKDQNLVFAQFDGEPIHPKRFSSAFSRRMKSLGYAVTFHGLRHSYTSMHADAGTSLKVVSEALGHANVAITADLYTHVFGSHQREVAERLTALFDRAEKRA